MDDTDKPVEDYKPATPMTEELLLDISNGESPPVADHFDGKAEHNLLETREFSMDVDKHLNESVENSGSFCTKVDDTVITPEVSETAHSFNGSQEMIVKNTMTTDQSHEECAGPELGENTASEHCTSQENVDETSEHNGSAKDGHVVLDSEISGETELEDKTFELKDVHEQPIHNVLEHSEDDTENNENEDTEPENLSVPGPHEAYEDQVVQETEHPDSCEQLKQISPENEILNNELQYVEQQEGGRISENKERIENPENEVLETADFVENVITEANQAQTEHMSDISEHDPNEQKDQLSHEMEAAPGDYKETESILMDLEKQNFTDVVSTDDEIHESDIHVMGSIMEEHDTEQDIQESQNADIYPPSDESLKYPDSGSLDTVSINPNEEASTVSEECTEMKEIPEITIEETESTNGEEPEDNNPTENSVMTSNEAKDVQIGTENILHLDESIKPLESSNENLDTSIETANVSMEEELTLSKAYSQAHETYEAVHPTSCEENEADSIDMNEAELQTIEVNSEYVEIKTNGNDFGYKVADNSIPISKIKLETTEAVSAEVPEQEIVTEATEIDLSESILEEKAKKEQILEVIECQPTEVKEQIVELEAARPPPMEIIKSVLETEIEEIKMTEMEEPLNMRNGDFEPVNSIDEPRILLKYESLKENVPSVEEDKENTKTADKNDEMNGKEVIISDDELDFDTRYAMFVGKVLPGHEIYYLPENKKKVTFRKGGTLDNRRSGSPIWEASINGMPTKSATLGAPRRIRRRPQPKPAVNDDHLFPDSVTPSKVEKALSEDDTSASNDGEGSRYDVPFIDDDAFVSKKHRSAVMIDDDSSSESDYSNEMKDLIISEHLAKMDEASPRAGRTEIDGKRNINQTRSRLWFGLSICGCFRRRR